MPIMRAERPERYSPKDASHLPNELARLREKRVGAAAIDLSPQVITASMQGETVLGGFVMHVLGEEEPVIVRERTVDNFWLHKPA